MVGFFLPQRHGLVILPDGTPNGDVSHEPVVGAITVVSQEAAHVLESAGEGPLGKTVVPVLPDLTSCEASSLFLSCLGKQNQPKSCLSPVRILDRKTSGHIVFRCP